MASGNRLTMPVREGTSNIHLALDEEFITAEGNYRLKNRTNNFGELTGLYLAIQVAMKLGQKKIFGDSKLVIEYWSKGYIRKEKAKDPDLMELVQKTKTLRQQYEKQGGEVLRVSVIRRWPSS